MQAELEDEILQLLSSATGNLLDNVQLINTLNASKTTWEQVNQSLQVCSYLVMLMPALLTVVSQTTLPQHASSQTLLVASPTNVHSTPADAVLVISQAHLRPLKLSLL